MRKVKRLMILSLFVTSCSNPNNVINTNPTPSPTISSSTSVNPIPTTSSSVTLSSPTPSSSISPMPSLAPTPITSVSENPNAIKKVELYYNTRNTLFYSPDTKIENNRNYDFTLTNYEYYDFQIYAKITYNDGRSENKEIILESSDKEIAHVQNGILYLHSKDNKSGFNLIIQEKETTKEIASYKIELGGPTGLFDIKEAVTLHGKIYDKEGNIIKNTILTFKYIDPQFEGFDKYPIITQPTSGDFKIDYVRSGGRIELTVSKEGYKTVTRKLVSRGNLTVDSNQFDFGGEREEDKPYALEKL